MFVSCSVTAQASEGDAELSHGLASGEELEDVLLGVHGHGVVAVVVAIKHGKVI